MAYKKVISIDIDGVLNNYPQCWIDYVNMYLGRLYQTKNDIKLALTEKLYQEIKDEYRNSGYKINLPVDRMAVEIIDTLKYKGYYVIVVTSRPIFNKNYPTLYNITKQWLCNNKINYDYIYYKYQKEFILDGRFEIHLHIDDELEDAIEFARRNINVLLYNKYSNCVIGGHFENIFLINDIHEILEYL